MYLRPYSFALSYFQNTLIYPLPFEQNHSSHHHYYHRRLFLFEDNNQPQTNALKVKRGEYLRIVFVDKRDWILFHPANNALKGCIAPVTNLTGAGTGSESRIAVQKIGKASFWNLGHTSKSKPPDSKKRLWKLSIEWNSLRPNCLGY